MSTPELDQIALAIAARWEAAWNRHDMSLLPVILADDVDFISVAGARWKGAQEVREVHARMHRLQFADSRWSTRQVGVQLLREGVALAHVDWTIEGEAAPDGSVRPPRQGIFSWLLVESDGVWRIRAAQNTNRAGPA